MDNKEVVKLIKYAVEHLLDGELLPENDWSESDIKILNDLKDKEFEVKFAQE